MTVLVVLAAVMVSLAVGVLLAYGVCRLMFQVLRVKQGGAAARSQAVGNGVLVER